MIDARPGPGSHARMKSFLMQSGAPAALRLAAAAMLSLGMAACGGDDTSDTGPGTTDAGPDVRTDTTGADG